MEFCVTWDLAVGVDELEQFSDEFALERQGAAGDGPAAERADVDARMAVPTGARNRVRASPT